MLLNAYSGGGEGLLGVRVVSAGHIFAEKGRRIQRPNGREDWLLFYVAKGAEEFSLGVTAVGTEGSFVLFRPHERQEHVCVSDKTSEFYYVHFHAPQAFGALGLESSTLYQSKLSTGVCDLFGEIITELQCKHFCYEQICVAKLLTLLALLARRSADTDNPYSRYEAQISFVIQQMSREYASDRSLEEYAAMCRMSKFHFTRTFKAITGCSPMEYRNDLRIEHAKDLLEDVDVPIAEIGARTGYSSASYFCDAFKKRVGISPLRYRNQVTAGGTPHDE